MIKIPIKKQKIKSKKNRKTQTLMPIPLKPKIFDNCSPIVKNKTPVANSCLLPEVLIRIKDEYNNTKPESEKIKKTDYNEIWHELKNRLTFCENEKCWLNEIKNKQIKNEINEYIFAPNQPPEWKNNPKAWLSNFDILAVLKQYEQAHPKFKFIGPTPIDFDKRLGEMCVTEDLCKFSLSNYKKSGKTKIGICFNLSPHTSGGSHWVSMFIDMDEQHIFFMDSNGMKCPTEIKIFIQRICQDAAKLNPPIVFKITQNEIEHQSENTECGMYSLFFITTMLTGEVIIDETRKIKNMTMADKIRLFSSVKIPDSYVAQYRYKFFNV
jgi:hypothetical protein